MNPQPLTCPACGAALAGDLEAAETACPACGKRVRALLFPAFRRPTDKAAEAVRAGEGEAACFYHEARQAEAVCDACGRFLCDLCRIPFGARTLCPSCLALTRDPQAEAHLPRRLRYDKLALFVILISPLIYCASFLNAILALFLCLRYCRAPLSVVPRNRWRFGVAGALALLLLVAWLALAAFFVSTLIRFSDPVDARLSPRPARSAHAC